MRAARKNVAVACLVLCVGWCLAQPTTVSVTVPDYVVERVGDVDHVSIPGGQMLVEEDGRPVVPYFIRKVKLPAGWRVQDVVLKERSGLETDSGLRLPTVQPDLGPAAAALEQPFPEKEFAWSARYDESPALYIFVYPFRYEPATGRARFHREHEFEVSYARSDVRIAGVTPGQAAYEPGEAIEFTVLIENGGDARDAMLTAHATRHIGPGASVEVATRVVRLGKSNSVVLAWPKPGAVTGVYDVEVVVRDPEGNELDRNGTVLRIGAPRGEVTTFKVEPTVFRVGDDINLELGFRNTGSCDLSGECVFQVRRGGEQLAEMVVEMPNTGPGATRTFRQKWSTTATEKSAVYTAVGFVRYEGTACEPARVEFSTNVMPAAAFTATGDTVATGEEVTFDAAGSRDDDGRLAEYRWDFGDGGKAAGSTAGHAWMQPGDFTVRLTVIDDEGGSGMAERVVSVVE
ncbi:MAG: PKD domain-containing protein [bacterium]